MFEKTPWGWFLGLGITISSACVSFANSAIAQITPDRTLPNNSRVTTTDNIRTIEGGTSAGSNLFHSFEQFSVPNGGEAYFNNASNIQNIINRVTGSSISNIDGLIRANGNANLFLLNPNGIIFGRDARLNIGGSFIATTADAIGFGKDGFFSALTKEPPSSLLTVNPSALLFNRIPTAPIQNNSVAPSGLDPSLRLTANGLRVPDGQNLFLVGGNISIDGGGQNGGLYAFGGRVELGGLASKGTVGLNGGGKNLSLSFPEGVERSDVSLTNNTSVNVGADNGGSIAINARNLELAGESAFSAGIATGLGSVNSKAGDIDINAQASVNFKNGSNISNLVQSGAVGRGGNINIRAESVFLTDGALLNSSTLGQGNAGDLNIDTTRLVVRDSQIGASTFGKGDAGNLTVRASDSVELTGETPGNEKGFPGGLFFQVDLTGEGKGGNLTIETGRLSVSDGSKVQVATFGQGDAGNLYIRASEVEVFETPRYNFYFTTINAGVTLDPRTVNPPKGNGGDLTIESDRLSVRNGGQISVSTQGQGNAGTLRIRASEFVEVVGTSAQHNNRPSEITAAVTPKSTGSGGNLSIETARLIVRDKATVSVRSQGTLQAGNLEINARSIDLNNQATVTATTRSGNGGNITLRVEDLLLLRRNSQISTTAGTASAGGNGGNITINTPSGFIVAPPNENSDITANAFSGTGGRVTINATNIFGIAPLNRQNLEKLRPNDLDPAQLPTNDITAISQQNPSLSGTVELNTPDIDPSRGLVQLPINLVDASQQIDTSCNPGSRQIASSFFITGRGGLPTNPQEILTHDSVLVDLVNLQPDTENRSAQNITSKKTTVTLNTPQPIIEATTWIKNHKGEVILMANVPTATPYNPSLTPASCRGFSQ